MGIAYQEHSEQGNKKGEGAEQVQLQLEICSEHTHARLVLDDPTL